VNFFDLFRKFQFPKDFVRLFLPQLLRELVRADLPRPPVAVADIRTPVDIDGLRCDLYFVAVPREEPRTEGEMEAIARSIDALNHP
jgi:hypothetical protein